MARSQQRVARSKRRVGTRYGPRVGLRWFVAAALVLASCARPAELSVDLRTDLPRSSFDTVVTTVEFGGQRRELRRPLSPGEGFLRGGRVADVRGLSRGPVEVEVRLENAGAPLAQRRVRLTALGDYALTVTIDAACQGVVCEGETPSCSAGVCVRMECGGDVPGACGELSCATDAQCALPGCAASHCEHGGCVCAPAPDAGATDAGPPDAGPPDAGPPCACAFEEVDTERRACGCGAGMEERTRTCDGCQFDEFGPWVGCASECGPGDIDEETRPCGPCGGGVERRTRTCDASCSFGGWSDWSSCEGPGECAPGATRTGCDPCGHEVCSSSCTWGSCEPFSGFECLRIRPGTTGPPGNHYRCCGTRQWQFCLDTCMWSAVCESCTDCTDC